MWPSSASHDATVNVAPSPPSPAPSPYHDATRLAVAFSHRLQRLPSSPRLT